MVKVSIIVPVYNVQDYIHECVDSLISQTCKDIEIILVDDGSTDNSGKICDEYSKMDKRIRVLHKENGGQSSARNLGYNNSIGEYVIFIDSDDYITENTIEVLLSAAEEYGVDIVHGDLLNDLDLIVNSNYRRLKCDNKKVTVNEFLKEKIKTETYDIVPFLYFVKKAYIDKYNIRFLEGYIYEDQLWTMELLSHVGSVLKIRFPYYYYRMKRPNSTTNKIKLKNGMDSAVICNEMAKYILQLTDEGIKQDLSAVMLISSFQFISVWRKMSRKDRKTVWSKLDNNVFKTALKYEGSYDNLKKDVLKFTRHRHILILIYDVKSFLRRCLGRE